MKSMLRDVKVGVFYSPHMAGDVKLAYCPHRQMLMLQFRSKDGVELHDYDVTKPREMSSLMLDALALAAEPVDGRV